MRAYRTEHCVNLGVGRNDVGRKTGGMGGCRTGRTHRGDGGPACIPVNPM
jgi:hypothetical protein